MQSGRIAPVFRQFFTGALGTKNATDSNPQQQQQQPEKEPDREPTRDEVLQALELLIQHDEFRKNALRAEVREEEGRFFLLVFNAAGAQLRAIRGQEIFRLINNQVAQGPRRGQILDRRI
jgi:hypothetical protein